MKYCLIGLVGALSLSISPTSVSNLSQTNVSSINKIISNNIGSPTLISSSGTTGKPAYCRYKKYKNLPQCQD